MLLHGRYPPLKRLRRGLLGATRNISMGKAVEIEAALAGILLMLLLSTASAARWTGWNVLEQLTGLDSLTGVTDQPAGSAALTATRGQWVSKYAGEAVKSPRPLIGILTQPCSLCPGK